MALPEKTYNQITLDDGLGQDIQWVAPQIGVATTATNLNQSDQSFNGGYVFEWPAMLGVLFGARKPLPAARDLSGSQFIWFSGFTNQYATVLKLADLDDGGLRFYITDSAGAYKGWTIYGRDISGGNPNPAFGFVSFASFNATLSQMWWCIDLDRTPDYSSGTLDLTDIVAIEVHVQNNTSIGNLNAGRFACGYLLGSDKAIIRSGEVANPASFATLPGTTAPWSDPSNPLYPGGARTQSLTPIGDGANGDVFQVICPVQVGDGLTATYFRQSRGQMAMQPSMEAIKYRISQGETPSLLPVYLPNDDEDCTHTVNQSASDDVEIADFVWSAYDYPTKGYAFEVTGNTSGTCDLVRNSFFRAQFVKLGHATATDCVFDNCGFVDVNANSAVIESTIRNAPSGSDALVISGGAGDYSHLTVRLNNPDALHDIAVGSGGSGTYDLSGITVPNGYTLKVHNSNQTSSNFVPSIYSSLLDGEFHPQTADLRLDTNEAPGTPLPENGAVTFLVDFEKSQVEGTVELSVRPLVGSSGPSPVILRVNRVTGLPTGGLPPVPYGVVNMGDAWRLWLEIDFTQYNSTDYDRWIMDMGASDDNYSIRGPMVLEGSNLDLECQFPCLGAITVILSPGITVETSTEGGSITVESPPATFTVSFPNWLSGTRYQVYNATTSSEIVNDYSEEVGVTVDLEVGADCSVGDEIRVRALWVSGTEATLEFEQFFVVPAGGGTTVNPEELKDDTIYNGTGLAGENITMFSYDYVNTDILVNTSQNFTSDTLYAWQKYSIYAEPNGMLFFGAVIADGNTGYLITDAVDAKIGSSVAGLIVQTDSKKIQRFDGAYPGNFDPSLPSAVILNWKGDGIAVEVNTGSGLTAEQAIQLAAAASVPEKITVVNNGVKKASLLIPHTEDV